MVLTRKELNTNLEPAMLVNIGFFGGRGHSEHLSFSLLSSQTPGLLVNFDGRSKSGSISLVTFLTSYKLDRFSFSFLLFLLFKDFKTV